MKFVSYIMLTILVLLILTIGWLGNDIYRDAMNHRDINGLWIHKNFTNSEVQKYVASRDIVGDWVCINIRGMTIPEIITTCEHEAAHEVFAEYCEDTPLECLKIVGVKNDSK